MSAREQWQREIEDAKAYKAWLESRGDREPIPEPVKTKCTNCTVPCIGRYCQACLPSGPDDRRVRRSK